jgi:hypothetical protein
MKKNVLMIVGFIILSLTAYNQENNVNKEIELTVISQANQGNSYITFPTDIGNIEPLWFEGNVIPNFYLRKSKNSHLMGVITPQIIVRMFREKSAPVQTPSYMPQITLYYLFKERKNIKNFSAFGRITHHSNGQDGTFFLENGEINLKSGDFYTNYYETGFIITNINTRFKAYQFFKSSIEIHPKIWIKDELDGLYGRYRWHNTFSIFKLSSENEQKANFSIKGETTWILGNLNNWDNISIKRLNLSLTLYYQPEFLEDIGFFVQYYHGADYYNLYFGHRLNIIRFGFMTEKLRF